MSSIPQRLYDSEINFMISTFWDGGFDWCLGHELGGYQAEGTADTYDEAVAALAKAARTRYRDSAFAREGNLPQ